MLAEAALVEDRVDFEDFRKFVQGVDGVVMSGDEKIAADDKVDFLLAGFMRMAERGKMEDGVEVLAVEFDAWLLCRKKQLFSNKVREREFFHDAAYFVAGRILKVDPRDRAMFVAREHGDIVRQKEGSKR